MTDMKHTRCCFTGHRPEKLSRSEMEIIPALRREIVTAIDDGFVVFISGMSRGVDIWAAEEVLRLRDGGEHIRLVCAVPFEGFECRWPAEWQRRYTDILLRSDVNCRLGDVPSRESYLARDRWMVNQSARVIAVYDGSPGGTKYTVDYALKNGVDVRIV